MRFSPGVCVYPPSSLFLDATGLERLYGGLENFRRRVAQALASLRVTAAVTIAPTPGAAWALAAFGKNGSHIVTNEQVLPALSPLPPEALRLDSKTVGLLSALGVRTIGSLLQLSRNDLAVRFGPAILMRIDQATGAVHEPLTYLVHRSPIRATLEFEGAIESLDAIHFAVQELTRQIAAQLAARGQGARELRLTFRQPYASPVEKVIRLVRPCRNESALVKLICCAIENLEASEGFVAATLAVVAAERLGDEQAALIGGEEERDAAELDHLVERLRRGWIAAWNGENCSNPISLKTPVDAGTLPVSRMLPARAARLIFFARSGCCASRVQSRQSFDPRRAAMANLYRSPITVKFIGSTTSGDRSESPANGGTGGGRPATTSMFWMPPAIGIGSSASRNRDGGFCMGYSSDGGNSLCPKRPIPNIVPSFRRQLRRAAHRPVPTRNWT